MDTRVSVWMWGAELTTRCRRWASKPHWAVFRLCRKVLQGLHKGLAGFCKDLVSACLLNDLGVGLSFVPTAKAARH